MGFLVFAGALASRAESATPTKGDAGRSVHELAAGWRFRFGGDPAGVTDAGYDDRSWETVTIPHTWNRVGEYGLTPSPAMNNSHGIGWYRLHLDVPANVAGRHLFLQFDAVGNIAEVWVNGVHVGRHEGAFSRFRFDVTDQLKPGATNVIVVKADNSKPAIGASTENIIPLGGDFFVNGGIYRQAALIDTDSAQIDLLDYGSPGVYLSTPEVTDTEAKVMVLTKLRNLAGSERALTLVTTVRDAANHAVASDSVAVKLTGASATDVRRVLTLPKPRRWRGREDPYLYAVTVELRERDRLIDRVKQPLGVRTFHFDANNGFSLNGQPLPLRGASRHQDRLGKGWALSPQDHAEDMAIMAEMGVNTIRGAHYQHAQEWYDAADRTGMVMWAEVPFVHQSSLSNEAPTKALIDNGKSQLVELIRQNYNHPSIVTWSVGNETDIRPVQLGIKTPAQSLVMLKALNDRAKQEDPSRPTAYADCCEDAIPGQQILSNVTDVIGYNRYFGWYYGKPEDLGAFLDKMHARYPAMPVGVSEYGAGGGLSQHTDNPLGGPINVFGRPHPEEYQSWVHEQSWKALEARHYLAGVWIWNMFDFPSDLREEGDAIYLNDKGMVSFDRKVRKDVFYFYKAQWSTEPVLHITSRRYVDRAYPVTDVRVYSNADKATLAVNGVALGEAACPERICVWSNIALRPGKNEVRVSALIHGHALSDTITWNAPDAAHGMHIKSGSLSGLMTADGQRFGSDNFFAGGEGKTLNPFPHGSNESRPDVSPRQIKDAKEPALYAAYREGAFQYRIPLPNGRWQVTLFFAEPDATAAASRTFSVKTGATTVLDHFNPSTAAGGAFKAVERHFPVEVKDGKLVLDFVPEGGSAIVSAIAVTPN
ncbi:glycoside hydrolase family 2 TIM barrel-domain containing protein [Dyella sp. Tek66A03]|uniref:glycoside hydrolase family 2 TIM barrel-domain containing protein n=1 Tax=Dyella sp. Tek66A03 TaxID=3458298 RepID=UPI00403EB9CE